MAFAAMDAVLESNSNVGLVCVVDVFSQTVVAHRNRDDLVATYGVAVNSSNTAVDQQQRLAPPSTKLVETYVSIVSAAALATMSAGVLVTSDSTPSATPASMPEAWSIAQFSTQGWDIVAYRPTGNSKGALATHAANVDVRATSSSSQAASPARGGAGGEHTVLGGRWFMVVFTANASSR
jgi:hypothetical protein